MTFQNERGGRIRLEDIQKPARDEWGNGLDAMEAALELEKTVNQALLDLHKVADTHGDFQVTKHLAFDIILATYLLHVVMFQTSHFSRCRWLISLKENS